MSVVVLKRPSPSNGRSSIIDLVSSCRSVVSSQACLQRDTAEVIVYASQRSIVVSPEASPLSEPAVSVLVIR